MTPAILAIAFSLGGCDLETPDDPVFLRDHFKRLICQGSLDAEEAVSRLKSTPQLGGLIVEAHDITAGPPGKVVTVDMGNESNPALQIILVFEKGANYVSVYGTKAGEPTTDDIDLVDSVVQGAHLSNCTPVSE